MAPLNDGPEPVESEMMKVSSGNVSKTPRGSFRSLRVPSPVFVMVVVTFRFSNPSTLTVGVEVLRVRLGAAEMETAETMRTTREAQGEENIVI